MLKPGGRPAITVWADASEHRMYEAVFSSISRRLGIPYEAAGRPFLFGELLDLESLLNDSGCSDVQAETREFDITCPSADMWARLTVMAAAAIPAFRELSDEDRNALAPGVAPDVGDLLPTACLWLVGGHSTAVALRHRRCMTSVRPAKFEHAAGAKLTIARYSGHLRPHRCAPGRIDGAAGRTRSTAQRLGAGPRVR